MQQNFGFGLEQKQNLALSQNLIQSLNILTLSTVELRENIFKELEENPTLEIVRDPLREKQSVKKRSKNYETNKRKTNSSADDYQNFLESIPDIEETLQSHLLQQLRLQELTENEMIFAKILIQNLDESGFNIINISELQKLYNEKNQSKKISNADLEKIVKVIQNLEPVGTCVDNAMQSLQVQAKILFGTKSKNNKNYFFALDLLENHSELFKLTNRTKFFYEVKKINAEYKKLNFDDIKNILECISELNPAPGKLFSPDNKTIYAIPEVFVFKSDEGFRAEVNNVEIPTVKISKTFTEHSGKIDSTELKNALQNANQFIESLNYRRESILKVVNAILIYQKDFFEKGPKYLLALKQQDIADELKLSASSISRTVNGKYLQCDWGIFELKYFFSAEVSTFGNQSDSSVSKNAVKEMIKQIIAKEEKITDAKISERLKLKGINISRRTVNKYRNEILAER